MKGVTLLSASDRMMAAVSVSILLFATAFCLFAPDCSAACERDCTITFMNGDDLLPPQPVVFEVLDGREFEVEGRDAIGPFIGWFTSPGATGFCPGNIDYRDEPVAVTLTATGSGTLYALYGEISDMVCLILDPSGGVLESCVAGSEDDPDRWRSFTPVEPYGARVLPTPVREGYEFVEWTTGSMFFPGGEEVYIPFGPGEEVALTAVWEPATSEIHIGDVPAASGFAGEPISITLTADVADCATSVSGAPGFSVAHAGGGTYVLTGEPPVGQTVLTVTLSKAGFVSGSCTVAISAAERLVFISSPSAGVFVVS